MGGGMILGTLIDRPPRHLAGGGDRQTGAVMTQLMCVASRTKSLMLVTRRC
jgi:hypothetical protein